MATIVHILTILLILAPVVPGGEIEQRERELQEIRRRLLECRKEKEALEGREVSLLNRLEGIDKELNLTHRMLTQLKEKEERTERELEGIEAKITDTEGRLQRKQKVLYRRLVSIYKRGKLHPWEILLSTRNFTDGFRRMKYLTLIARQDRRVYSQILSLKNQLEGEKKSFGVKLEELKKVTGEKESEEENIEKEKGQKKRLLARVRDKKDEQEKIAEELIEAEKRLQKLIEELERRRKEELARVGEPEGIHYFDSHKGRLIWPTEGEVISRFGRQIHPRYLTSTKNNGIDIKARRDSPVVAVGDGVVAYADRFLGYGEIALLDHGGGFYTLYAHVSEALVEVGDEVKKGDLIARVGETGSLEGPVLHFELRVDGRPVDPVPWLRRR